MMLPKLKGGLIPMLAITGKPTREKMRKRMQDYLEVGIDQVLIYPRSGLEFEYMGEEWLDFCRNMVEDAAEIGVGIWLYDELNWPSGTAGGKVVAHNPEFASRQFVGKKVNGNIEWTIEYKERFPHLLDQKSEDFADLLNPEAMKYFIEITHEAYAKAFGEHMGKTVLGIFTDEPSFYYGLGGGKVGEEMYVHYYDGIEEDYRAECGRDLREDLSCDFDGKENPQLWKTYYKLLGARFEKTFFKPCAEWCDKHNIYFTGHLMCDHSVGAGLFASGDAMKCLDTMSLPGLDEIGTRTNIDGVALHEMKLAGRSAARNGGGLAELFALGPCDMTFANLRQMLWLTAAHGIDHYVLAIAPVDVRGGKVKDEYFTAFTPIDPRFKEYAAFSEDTKEAVKLAHTPKSPGVVFRYPNSICAAQQARPDVNNNETQKANNNFTELLRLLNARQWPVRFIAEDEEAGENIALVEFTETDMKVIAGNKTGSAEDIEGIAQWLEQNCTRSASVKDSNGQLATELFIETFADSSVVAINHTDKEKRNLTVSMQDGSQKNLDLGAFGVCRLETDKGEGEYIFPESKLVPAAPEEWAISLDRDNLKLCSLLQDGEKWKCEINVKTEVKNARLLVLEGNVAPTLDGETITINNRCDRLPEGLTELYVMSDPLALTAGKHVIEFNGKFEEYNFIRGLYIAGNFALDATGDICDMPKTVVYGDLCKQGLKNFVGRVMLEGQIEIPQNADKIRFDTAMNSANLTINGTDCGARIWDDFAWQIPESAKGKTATCQLEISTPLANLFQKDATFGNWNVAGPGAFSSFGIMREPEII